MRRSLLLIAVASGCADPTTLEWTTVLGPAESGVLVLSPAEVPRATVVDGTQATVVQGTLSELTSAILLVYPWTLESVGLATGQSIPTGARGSLPEPLRAHQPRRDFSGWLTIERAALPPALDSLVVPTPCTKARVSDLGVDSVRRATAAVQTVTGDTLIAGEPTWAVVEAGAPRSLTSTITAVALTVANARTVFGFAEDGTVTSLQVDARSVRALRLPWRAPSGIVRVHALVTALGTPRFLVVDAAGGAHAGARESIQILDAVPPLRPQAAAHGAALGALWSSRADRPGVVGWGAEGVFESMDTTSPVTAVAAEASGQRLVGLVDGSTWIASAEQPSWATIDVPEPATRPIVAVGLAGGFIVVVDDAGTLWTGRVGRPLCRASTALPLEEATLVPIGSGRWLVLDARVAPRWLDVADGL